MAAGLLVAPSNRPARKIDRIEEVSLKQLAKRPFGLNPKRKTIQPVGLIRRHEAIINSHGIVRQRMGHCPNCRIVSWKDIRAMERRRGLATNMVEEVLLVLRDRHDLGFAPDPDVVSEFQCRLSDDAE